MYQLSQSLLNVPGIGDKIFAGFTERGITTIKNLLLLFPFRYEDRSQSVTVEDLWKLTLSNPPKTLYTIVATVEKASNNYFRGRSMQKATFIDTNGDKLYATWFNNPFMAKRLTQDKRIRISGSAKSMGKKMFLTQPLVEDEDNDAINTNRLVPIYSSLPFIKPTTLRKIFKHILEHLAPIPDELIEKLQLQKNPLTPQILPIQLALSQLHFPDNEEMVIQARERFAVEEIMYLIQRSHQIKQQWKSATQAFVVDPTLTLVNVLPTDLPFTLTNAQHRCISEILKDCQQSLPMNRLLLGDVGSGKTIVAGAIMQTMVRQGAHACLIAPTQVLAEQHALTLAKFFPNVNIKLITGKTTKHKNLKLNNAETKKPHFIIGTHAVLNFLQKNTLNSPVGLMVFDEQHRFGVNQRASIQHMSPNPHVLTMTATPIPRSLMLTIFSHLSLSVIDELPANRIPTKTWILTETKRLQMYNWLIEQITPHKKNLHSQLNSNSQFQALIICPFIDPSSSEALENIAAVKEKFKEIDEYFSPHNIKVGLLHGRQKQKEKDDVIKKLFSGDIDILVTTPIVEVGIDLPQASAIIIEASERFGLASLHQLRGRVGRAGQQGFCMLFSNSLQANTKKRLQYFQSTLIGQELAEFDLERRGAGDIFGTQQHGFDELQFANWSDVKIITLAKQLNDYFTSLGYVYHSPLLMKPEIQNNLPVAN